VTATRIVDLRAMELDIPFTTAFSHASATRAATSSVWVEARSTSGRTGFGESCPRPYVTGETVESALAFVAAHAGQLQQHVTGPEALADWMRAHSPEIDRHPAAWCAIELALLDLLAKDRELPVESLLGLPAPRGPFRYTALVGDGPPDASAATVARYRRSGFTDFKIKLSGDPARDAAKFEGLGEPGLRLRVDANNLWRSAGEAIAFLRTLAHPLFAVEEPIGANQYAELLRVADALDSRIVLDESLLRAGQIADLPGPPARWIANVRVSKTGGLLRSIEVTRAARSAGIGVIVGAQVGETSLLTRAGLTVAQFAGSSLVAQEGAFGTHLLQRDVCDPPLMFGAGGVLDPAAHGCLDAHGFGLTIAHG
jgi:L-alanine-DL-glutamate epimerase-like enolase superfamily enzyme